MKTAVSRMMRPAVGLALALCAATALMAQTAAKTNTNQQAGSKTSQQAKARTKNSTPTIGVTVNEVYLTFSVMNRRGQYIQNLKQDDFALLDDHRAPAKVFSFEQQTNLPLRVGIMVDTSSSIRRRFEFEQQAAISFLLNVIRPRTDRAFVEGFDSTPDYRTGWTNSLDGLTQGIDSLHPGGGTALYDALYATCRDRMLPQREEPIRKALILMSDGDDDQSHAYLTDAIRECQRANTTIYAVSTNVSPSRDRGDKVLKQLAYATGGRAYFPDTLKDMPVSFKQIQDDLRSQYALAYRPADFKANGQFRPIYLVCLDRKYKVNVQKGYYAPTTQ